MNDKKAISSYLTLVFCTLILFACTSSEDDKLSSYINDIKARPGRPIEPIPEFVPLKKFIYPEVDDRRSPFKKKEITQATDKLAPNLNRLKQPLEFFPLDALKFVGILKQGSLIWGLISQPNGEVTRVKVGNYMGKNFGKIISITEQNLKLEETVQVDGKWEKRMTTFSLNAGE